MGMNVHVVEAAPAEPIKLRDDMEDRVNDLARLARATYTIAERLFSELRCYAEHMPQVETALALLDADREVLEDMICEVDIQARDLRAAYYQDAEAA